ncbi:universal stress protein [Maribacter sp. 2307ULW6-5]|uniref:universal stress protein n=1 Tax=Maribacter sp. 2307ULW6-5 TaxID=3386275 RepID=UPI0039BC7D4B
MKTLIHATDYSSNAVDALHYANALRLQLAAKLILVHVYQVPLTMGSTTSISHTKKVAQTAEEQRKRLRTFCNEHLGQVVCDRAVDLRAIQGTSVREALLALTTKESADLVVMGTQGENLLRKYVLGSTTTALLEHAPCPILAIPPNRPFRALKNMVYATDFEASDRYALKALLALAKPFRARVHVVHIAQSATPDPEKGMAHFKAQLEQELPYEDLQWETHFGQDPYATLQEHLAKVEADMVVMLERENGGFLKNLGHRDWVKRMKADGALPLLCYQKKNLLPQHPGVGG